MPTAAIYVVFLGLCQAFFMGLLFLLSGYFTPPAYDHKGHNQFLKDRLIRLGIPMVIFVGLVEPVVDYIVALFQWLFPRLFSELLRHIHILWIWNNVVYLSPAVLCLCIRRLATRSAKAYPGPSISKKCSNLCFRITAWRSQLRCQTGLSNGLF